MISFYKRIFKYIFSLILGVYLVLGMPISKSMASSEIQGKKAIILILDEISLDEMLNSDIPNMDILMKNGSIGLMNTRAKSRTSNKGSSYLSLGMGIRTLASIQGGLAFERNELYPLSEYNIVSEDAVAKDLYKLYTGKNPPNGEVINIAIGNIENTALSITPNNQVGLLGKMARENGIVTGIVGNSDLNEPSREGTMLAMDENGVIPYGSVGSDLLISDANILGGIKLNQEVLLGEVERILSDVDLLFIDYGDPLRIEKTNIITTEFIRKQQKIKAIERADLFLGQVMEKVNMEETLFLVISPNPSKEMVNQGNFALTPMIISGNNTPKGLLTSKTTRRQGLVTNFDFGPTIFSYFGIDNLRSFIGEPIEGIKNENPTKTLLENQEQSLYLRKYRTFYHWSFIILVGLALVGLYLPRYKKWKGLSIKIMDHLSLTVIAIPLTMMTVSLFGYKSIIFDLIYVLGGAFIISYTLNKIFKQKLMPFAILSLATSVLILIDIFFLQNLMIVSPLGSDAIAGGRFYGVGNDYMGILLGSTLLGFFTLIHLYKIKRSTFVLSIFAYMLFIIVGLSPFFGANVGGTLSAILILLILLSIIFDKKLSFKRMIFLIIGVIASGIILGVLDILFNTNPTHAGKAIQALLTGGSSIFIEIIVSKLKQVFWNLAHASWNVILFVQVLLMILLYKFKNEILIKVRKKYPNLVKGFIIILLGSTVIFLLNDTGTIAAALILIYLFIPLGILINDVYKIEN